MMKRKFLLGASFSALVLAAMAPWSASHANSVSVRVSTPEFGIRIGAPHFPVFHPVPIYRPAPVYQPVPVYYPRPYRYAPPAVIYTPPPRWGYGYGSYRGRDHHRHHWQHRHHDRGHGHNRHDHYGRHDRHGGR
jgi:hypothetical protein